MPAAAAAPLQLLQLLLLACACGLASAQQQVVAPPAASLTAGRLTFTLDPADQTAKTLGLAGAAGADGFTFTGGGKVSLGDASIRVRAAGSEPAAAAAPASAWSSFLTTGASPVPAGPCTKLPCRAALNFTRQQNPEAGGAAPPPFSILREWEQGPNSTLRLVFKVTNTGKEPLEVGGFGIAMPFAWAAGSDAGDAASTFADPAITGDHGYVTVTRLSGKREVLIITTGVDGARCVANKPGCRTSLEAWDVARAPASDAGAGAAARQRAQPVGNGNGVAVGGPDNGAREWLCHTKAYAEDWANASKAWLPATSMILPAG